MQQNNQESKKKELEEFYNNLDKSVDKYVNEMLKDDEINSLIPDYIEKKIYKNVFKLVFKIMRNATDSTKISFMDQEITLNFSPKTNDIIV